MKKRYFSNLENKYYYGISRTFWHILIGIAVIGGIIAILVIGYSYFPTAKKEVFKASAPTKTPYPKQSGVALSEILEALPKEKQQPQQEVATSETNDAPPTPPPPRQPANNDQVGRKEFDAAIAELKNELPPNKFKSLWEGQGKWVITDRVRYDMTQSDQYRKWVPTVEGFETLIIENTDYLGFKSYQEKSDFVRGVQDLIKPITGDQKVLIAKKALNFKNRTLENTRTSFQAMANVLKLYPDNQVAVGYELAKDFLKRNPNDGLSMLGFQEAFLTNIDQEQRIATVKILQDEYSNYYNNNLDGFKENTQQFSQYISDVPLDQQSLALINYYSIYRNKNTDRLNQIQEIENNYNQELAEIEAQYKISLANAESEFLLKNSEKEQWRIMSLKSAAIAFGSILLITVILLLLSMIRNVNRLAETLIETTKQQNKKEHFEEPEIEST